jgi:hypothetical protein
VSSQLYALGLISVGEQMLLPAQKSVKEKHLFQLRFFEADMIGYFIL